MATKVLLTDSTQGMVDDVKDAERIAGRPPLSDAATANWLIQLGYAALKPKRKVKA